MTKPAAPCPCDSGRPLSACCLPYLEGLAAPDAEALMRSRYTAYVLGREDYLLATWHPETRPQALHLEESPVPRWLGLKVLRHEPRGEDAAVVAFVARYKVGGRTFRLQEVSRFQRIEGRWIYLDGEVS